MINRATVKGVHRDEIPDIWYRVKPILSRAILKHTDEDADAALLDLMSEQSQLWVIGDFDAVCLTQIAVRQTVKVVWIYYVAGDGLDDWLSDLISTMKKFRDSLGCDRIEFTGRLGWQKKLKEHGFKRAMITMRLDKDGKED